MQSGSCGGTVLLGGNIGMQWDHGIKMVDTEPTRSKVLDILANMYGLSTLYTVWILGLLHKCMDRLVFLQKTQNILFYFIL